MVNKILLLIVAINFLLTLFLLYFIKQNYQTSQQADDWRKQEVVTFKSNNDEDLKNKVENLKEDIQKLEFQSNHLEKDWQSMQILLKDFDKKLMLIAAINNENVFVNRYGKETGQLVYLQEDWTLSKIPAFVKLTDSLKVFLPK